MQNIKVDWREVAFSALAVGALTPFITEHKILSMNTGKTVLAMAVSNAVGQAIATALPTNQYLYPMYFVNQNIRF